jgi:cell division protein FtsL
VIREERGHHEPRPPRAPRGQRPHRERDPRARRSLVAAFAAAALVVAGGLGLVALRLEQVQLAYRLDALGTERARAERLVRQFEVEVATLRAPSRLASRARQLGLITPSPEQVRLAREYVPAASGTVAGAGGPGAVAAATVAGSEALVR